jgi:hypothetical protein
MCKLRVSVRGWPFFFVYKSLLPWLFLKIAIACLGIPVNIISFVFLNISNFRKTLFYVMEKI